MALKGFGLFIEIPQLANRNYSSKSTLEMETKPNYLKLSAHGIRELKTFSAASVESKNFAMHF